MMGQSLIYFNAGCPTISRMSESSPLRRALKRSAGIVFAIAVAAASGGCNLLNDATSPSTSSPSTSTETFGGTVGVQGSSRSTFTVAQQGTVTVTLSALSPSVAMGLGIGTPNGTTACAMTSSTTSALPGSTPQLTVTEPAGSYCVSVYDVGNVTGTVTYSVIVAHP
jgi:hypothetical protein